MCVRALCTPGDVPQNVSVFEDSDELREFMTSRTFRAAMTPASCRAMVAKAKFTRSVPLDLPETLFLQGAAARACSRGWSRPPRGGGIATTAT